MLRTLIFLLALFLTSASLLKAAADVNDLIVQGNEFSKEKRYGEAIDQYQAALAADSDNVRVHLLLGLAYANLNKFDEAVRYTKKASELDPSYTAFYNLGLIYAANEQPLKAIEAFDQSLKLNPTSYLAEYQKGLVYSSKQDYEKAAQAYQRAIELNPNFEEAHIGLTGAAYKKGDAAQALAHIEELKSKQKNTLAQALEEWIKTQEG